FEVIESTKQDQAITFDALAAKTFGDATFDLTAMASSGLAISYTSSDETVATINGSTVTIVGAGTTTITATQAGDADFNAATPVEQVLNVNKASQTIAFNTIEDQFIEAETLELSATATSGLIVTFSVVSGPASLNGTTLIFHDIGEVTIEAQQAGNINYEVATSSQTFEIISVTSTTLEVSRAKLQVYPNPSSQYITLSGIEAEGTEMIISDMKGNLVKREQIISGESIDISNLKNGIYLIQMNKQQIRFIKK
ncbi:MAG: T9SS type A sorting domain-containing protein, partial [Fulvivirga sp.]